MSFQHFQWLVFLAAGLLTGMETMRRYGTYGVRLMFALAALLVLIMLARETDIALRAPGVRDIKSFASTVADGSDEWSWSAPILVSWLIGAGVGVPLAIAFRRLRLRQRAKAKARVFD